MGREFPGLSASDNDKRYEDRMNQLDILANSLSFFRKQFIIVDRSEHVIVFMKKTSLSEMPIHL